MQLKLRTRRDVRTFSVTVTAVVLLGNLILQNLLLPPQLAEDVRLAGSIIALTLAAPLSLFVGLRLHDIHRLTIDLQNTARLDPLTGALTRRAFYERAAMIGDRAATVIVADIDHFKQFNDHYGHATGDVALRRVARNLKSSCRQEDVVARFGGEEFVILLPETDVENGTKVAHRLCQRLREKPMSHNGKRLTITASFGVAQAAHAAEMDDAIARADAALYSAKRSGRDQVCLAG